MKYKKGEQLLINKGGFVMKTKDQIESIVKEMHRHIDFSGVILVKEKGHSL